MCENWEKLCFRNVGLWLRVTVDVCFINIQRARPIHDLSQSLIVYILRCGLCVRMTFIVVFMCAPAWFNLGSWPSGSKAHLDCRKGPFWTMQHWMCNVQIMDHFYYEYRGSIAINLFSGENPTWTKFVLLVIYITAPRWKRLCGWSLILAVVTVR